MYLDVLVNHPRRGESNQDVALQGTHGSAANLPRL